MDFNTFGDSLAYKALEQAIAEMASKRKKDLTLFAAITAKTSIYYNEKKKEICVEVDEAGLL